MTSSTPSFRPPSQADDTWFLNTAAQQIRDSELKRAERLNGRLAMLGFLIGVAIEALTGHGILQQLADLALLSQG
jgi:hypothetical protein